jgi:hypothetical protein
VRRHHYRWILWFSTATCMCASTPLPLDPVVLYTPLPACVRRHHYRWILWFSTAVCVCTSTPLPLDPVVPSTATCMCTSTPLPLDPVILYSCLRVYVDTTTAGSCDSLQLSACVRQYHYRWILWFSIHCWRRVYIDTTTTGSGGSLQLPACVHRHHYRYILWFSLQLSTCVPPLI